MAARATDTPEVIERTLNAPIDKVWNAMTDYKTNATVVFSTAFRF